MSLGSIPNDIKVPLVYIEIDNSQANSGTPAQAQKLLVIGQQLATGSATPLTLSRITTSESQMDSLYGYGSMMSRMLKTLRKSNGYTDVYALGVADLTGSEAVGEITVAATNAKAGVLALLIAGESVQVAVAADDDAATIATAIIAAVTANKNLPVTAALKTATTETVELTCKWNGATGNDIDVRYNYYDGEVLPSGVSLTLVEMTGGAGTPDMDEVIAAIPNEWYNHIVMPFNDTQSMNDLRDELVTRWGPLKMIEGIAYTAFRGTFAETGAFGTARNDFLFTCMGTNASPHSPFEFAAAYAGKASFSLGIDPARPLQTLVMTGILPPAKAVQWDMTERNLLLGDGIATYMVTPGGEVAIEREVSMYRVNAFGDPDPSYLDITTPATLGYLRYSLRTMVTNRFPRHKLANDDVLARLDPAQPVVTPKIMRNAMLELANNDWVPNGLMEDFDGFKDSLEVYRDGSDQNRLNTVFNPDIVNQFRIFAALMQFKL
ncbi:phage tail sheath subtilisin-like domain-containing protein [Shewanella sp. NIFS-20-20]|uniref:phage tail sheath subtilisin-like domain-containing protein n=1 Tax=Shewanella sp. NIFS-20-20 TaxID=2853806 RepID=UPI001C436996|nr:phage tail sheath subtilisin-like domain-containing protein [Shewanella sp. NIFS-20-20]MBV7315448.1 phage tail sheath subtilisin-like domain-containing protein [Shewanella sp. NIFS-20-20]